jgi:DNA polymerase alpha-associated DNA helicase A
MDKVLDRLEKFIQPTSGPSQQPNQLTRVLLGLSPPSDPSPLSSPIVFFDPNLNPSQRAAVQFALEANEVACIHGPPGTGKTWTLVEIVRQLVASRPPAASDTGGVGRDAHPKKILICGASNLAVDNILERLLLLPEQLNVTRVGHPARVMRGGPDGGRMLEAALEVRAGRSDEVRLLAVSGVGRQLMGWF